MSDPRERKSGEYLTGQEAIRTRGNKSELIRMKLTPAITTTTTEAPTIAFGESLSNASSIRYANSQNCVVQENCTVVYFSSPFFDALLSSVNHTALTDALASFDFNHLETTTET